MSSSTENVFDRVFDRPMNQLTEEKKGIIKAYLSGRLRRTPSNQDFIERIVLDKRIENEICANGTVHYTLITSIIFEMNWQTSRWRKLRTKSRLEQKQSFSHNWAHHIDKDGGEFYSYNHRRTSKDICVDDINR